MEWKYFSVWKWKADFCQNAREMERMAVLHYDHCLVMQHLRAWRNQTHDRLKDIHNWVCVLISALYTQLQLYVTASKYIAANLPAFGGILPLF